MPRIDDESSYRSEKGYPWLFFHARPSWVIGLFVTLLVIGVSGAFYLWYTRVSNDVSPDSIAGYSYAIAGTICLTLAAVQYRMHRRAHKHGMAHLNTFLNWHMFLGIMGFALLMMHSFGNFNPRTGTYALYGMIALVVSGFIGRALDRIMPRLIAQEVDKMLTKQGEDRIEIITEELEDVVAHSSQEIHSFSSSDSEAIPVGSTEQTLKTSWDLAYISLDATPQELGHENQQYRFIPDKQSDFTRPGALIPGAQEHISTLQSVQKSLSRELFYRRVIRYWRRFHIFLALLTIGLTLWHIEYAAQLLIPTLFH